jgi:probable HAF family extracellular repeat protein
MRAFTVLSPMRSRLLVATLSLLVSLFVALEPSGAVALQATPAVPRHYAVTDLGTLSGLNSGAWDVTSKGHATGSADVVSVATATPAADAGAPPPTHAFLWRDGTMTDLGTLGGATSDAIDINEADQITGGSDTADGKWHAFLWQDGVMTDLETLGGDYSDAIRINNRGQIVGLSTTAPGQELGDAGTHAFLWENDSMIDLGTFGGEFSRANGINDAGQVVGAAETADGAIHPFLWENGTMTDLGLVAGFAGARALRITANGLICGFTQDPVGTPEAGSAGRHAFFYRDGVFTDLGTLGGPSSYGDGVNTAGQVVGVSDMAPGTSDTPTHGFLWEDGTLFDLNDLLVPASGWEITGASGINEAGQIAGMGAANGVTHAILLTPQA